MLPSVLAAGFRVYGVGLPGCIPGMIAMLMLSGTMRCFIDSYKQRHVISSVPGCNTYTARNPK